MKVKKSCPYSDEDVLTMKKVTALIAAQYLGMTYESLIWMLRQDNENNTNKAPFGKAVHKKKWVYYIFPEELVKYKRGYRPEDEEVKKAEFLKLFKELNDSDKNQVKGFMRALIQKEAV